MSDCEEPVQIEINGLLIQKSQIVALYDAGDVTTIILNAYSTWRNLPKHPRIIRLSMPLCKVVSLLGYVPPIIQGHLARNPKQ